ncbi:Hypothetical protein GLP15_1876 [Giardia lamblia P15]|uniref:Uncharacterized protein n=1 Tax=Giardia intestinalis (strain P15) TaxID=658858 RepID=E1F2E7_GIAIA|nr:Hypothetical protein GLP15_1876 [Giardia lamblia P15]
MPSRDAPSLAQPRGSCCPAPSKHRYPGPWSVPAIRPRGRCSRPRSPGRLVVLYDEDCTRHELQSVSLQLLGVPPRLSMAWTIDPVVGMCPGPPSALSHTFCSWITVHRDARCHPAGIRSWAHRLCSVSGLAEDAVCIHPCTAQHAPEPMGRPTGAAGPSHGSRTVCCSPRGVSLGGLPRCPVPRRGRQAPRSCLWRAPGPRCSSVPPGARPPLSEPAPQRSRPAPRGIHGVTGASAASSRLSVAFALALEEGV